MTLQSSGAISLSNVNVELGRSSTAQISLGETAVRNLAGVASGAISLSNLYGKSSVTVQLASAYSAIHYPLSGTATAGFELNASGDVRTLQNTAYFDEGDWITPKSSAGNAYEARAVRTAGVNPSGTALNTWVPLGTTRLWSLASSTPGAFVTTTFTVDIRNASTQTILATTSVTLEVEVSDGFGGGGGFNP